jgi:hypothetical protein
LKRRGEQVNAQPEKSPVSAVIDLVQGAEGIAAENAEERI